MYKTILVPLDGSELAEAALPHAQALAKSKGAEIILLRVPVLPGTTFLARDPALASMVLKEMEDETREYMQAEVSKLKREGVNVKGISREGPVADTILEVAKEIHADMITMSTHGYSGVQRWLMGSVADKVVQHSPIPVMLIHPISLN